jgi:hypothetical protein
MEALMPAKIQLTLVIENNGLMASPLEGNGFYLNHRIMASLLYMIHRVDSLGN